ncbi:hypothetical protein TSAR_016426 [Trichomalopsis sarcophagae]|uniref:Uncharacterized protein n=1 Tax=Trichomalopsis sarcophagae TaxID=543379 RepID=A0A232FJZ2_9HYME|nr:hypothetical protein TSAR_016426 [Trichomalopsis sarcophagae]
MKMIQSSSSLTVSNFIAERMTANGNSPLDSMRTLEHYLSDIMRAGAADTPEHLKETAVVPSYERTKNRIIRRETASTAESRPRTSATALRCTQQRVCRSPVP